MKKKLGLALCFTLVFGFVRADQINLAEDDASRGPIDSGKNSGSGFGEWKLLTEGNDDHRHSGSFIATSDNNKDLNGIAQNGKAWGLFANGAGFEQAVAFRAFSEPLAVGDSFSFMMENGRIEKKFEIDDPAPGSIGLTLRSSNAADSPNDYNKDAIFEFDCEEGKDNYQIHDGTGADQADSGVPLTDSGVIVTVTISGADTYDLEIQTAADKKLTKLPRRKLGRAGAITSLTIFNRDGEKTNAFFNGLQVAREAK
jgi:hypothetical protein